MYKAVYSEGDKLKTKRFGLLKRAIDFVKNVKAEFAWLDINDRHYFKSDLTNVSKRR